MAKKKTDAIGPTRMVRMNRELADMLAWVCRARSATTADILETVLRPHLQAEYDRLWPLIRQMKSLSTQGGGG